MIAEYLIPNFNFDALIGLFIAIVGILILVLGSYMRIVPILSDALDKIGAILILGGIGYWWLVSFVQDVFSNEKLVAVLAVLAVLIATGVFLFWKKK